MPQHSHLFRIGKKTAERMCLELKDKTGELVIPRGTGTTITNTAIKKEDPLQLALARTLDYRKSEIDVALKSDSFLIWTAPLYKKD